LLGFLVLFLIGYIVYLHGKMVRAGLGQAEKPLFVFEKPQLPKALQTVADRLDKWKEEGRLTAEQHENLMYLLREDAAKLPPPLS
jgi:hypothetical protein